jgi:acyl carrier protein
MERNDSEIKTQLMNFIKSNFLLGADSKIFGDDVSLLEAGIIDSTGVMELVSFIEETFKVKVEDEELMPDNLDSLNKLTNYVMRKKDNAA